MSEHTFTVDSREYTFIPGRRSGVPIVEVHWTDRGESFGEWSADAPMPSTEEEAADVLHTCGWEPILSE